MIAPPRWTDEQLQADLAESTEFFRRERMEEPLEDYLEAFEDYQSHYEVLMEKTVDLTDMDSTAVDVLTDQSLLRAFRYLAGPPISDDDLKTVAEAATLNSARLRSDPELVHRIVRVVLMGIDRKRFPWVRENREPTEAERDAAVLASAALMATQRASTKRRSEAKTAQEGRVEDALLRVGFRKVPNRSVDVMAQAPSAGEFCGESLLSNRKADFIVTLWDSRLMPLECKVSNSSTNSVKRLNNDAAVKAGSWIDDLGSNHVVPVAVLSGVYKLHNLVDAQNRGLTLFWAHNLQAMLDWVETTRRL